MRAAWHLVKTVGTRCHHASQTGGDSSAQRTHRRTELLEKCDLLLREPHGEIAFAVALYADYLPSNNYLRSVHRAHTCTRLALTVRPVRRRRDQQTQRPAGA